MSFPVLFLCICVLYYCHRVTTQLQLTNISYIYHVSDQNAGRSHNIETGNCSFERVEQFKYLGKTLTNKNSIQEEIKSRLKSDNACYHSVQNRLSSSLLSKNLQIQIYRAVILPVV